MRAVKQRQLAIRRRVPAAFSLAELMIALVILGLGLLFIAAALPAGLEYTRQTIDQATAEAAGEYALERITASLRTAHDLYDHALARATPPVLARLDNIMRPRDSKPSSPPLPMRFPPKDAHEPLIKVRPLVVGNLAWKLPPGGQTYDVVDDTEQIILTYMAGLGGTPPNAPLEYDLQRAAATGLSLAENPVLLGIERVYPPLEPVVPYRVGDLMNNQFPYLRYQTRIAEPRMLPHIRSEQKLAFDRRIGWTAFYRRVSYDYEDEDTTFGNGNERALDPYTYEIIVVVTRRVSERHRFARQDLFSQAGMAPFERPQAVVADFTDRSSTGVDGGGDRILPMPWLIVGDTQFRNSEGEPLRLSPALRLNDDYYAVPNADNANALDRTLSGNFSPPPTISFVFNEAVAPLLPKGSVLIPAVNDQRYAPPAQAVGFVPSAPESLPIYEVLDVTPGPGDGQITVVVANNGYYPWFNPSMGLDARAFPFWIIPPSFVERSGRQPVFEDTSPVLRVFRRTIRISEIN